MTEKIVDFFFKDFRAHGDEASQTKSGINYIACMVERSQYQATRLSEWRREALGMNSSI